jgi:putative lipoic acid-binding regulatory protein
MKESPMSEKKVKDKNILETDLIQEKETLLKFPCSLPIKIIGKKSDEFETTVLQIFRNHFSNLKENCLEQKNSSKGTYLAMTVTVDADSKEQLDKLYLELTACPLVLWAL